MFPDVAWFDSTSALDSECDEEFYSVYDGVGMWLFIFYFTINLIFLLI